MGNGATAEGGAPGKGGKKGKGKGKKEVPVEKPVEKKVEEKKVDGNKEVNEDPNVVVEEPPDPGLNVDKNGRMELIPPDDDEPEDGVQELVLPEHEGELPVEEDGEYGEEEGEFSEEEEEEEGEGEFFEEPAPAPKSDRGKPVNPVVEKPKTGKKNEPVIDPSKPKSSRSVQGQQVKPKSAQPDSVDPAKPKSSRSQKSKPDAKEIPVAPKSTRSQAGKKQANVPPLKGKSSVKKPARKEVVEELDEVDDFEEEGEEEEEEEEEEGEWEEEEEEGEWEEEEEEEEGEFMDIRKHLKEDQQPQLPVAEQPQMFQSVQSPTAQRNKRLNAGSGRRVSKGRSNRAPSRPLSERRDVPSAVSVSATGQSIHSSDLLVNDKRVTVSVETPNTIKCRIRKTPSNDLKKLQFFSVDNNNNNNTSEPFMLILFEKVGAHVSCHDYFRSRQQKVESEGGIVESRTEKEISLKNINNTVAVETHFRLRFNNYFKYMWITVVIKNGLAVLAQYMYERRDQEEMSQVQSIVQTLKIEDKL